ncbi:MAG: DUF58 domain-containing protein [Saccharospirillaceae bacterium]|nr:DUF58 domain-containing protein [Pseudomonadales bacterium]NRB78858.1 DUF58 domain-containing protein [Saccharospirillaceae bacterium]
MISFISSIRPSKRNLIVFSSIVSYFWVITALQIWLPTSLMLSIGFLFIGFYTVFSIIDLFLLKKIQDPCFELKIEDKQALGRTMLCKINWSSAQNISKIHIDSDPELQIDLKGLSDFSVKAKSRGLFKIYALICRVDSIFLLWQQKRSFETNQTIKVYPNYQHLSRYNLLTDSDSYSQIGIKRQPKRGDGTDFHQLREYRHGDSLRQIDWNHTSQTNKLISRDYQQEKDQSIIIMLDTGRRMRGKTDEFTYFDHCLNTTLILTQTAIKQGDYVGMMSFGSTNRFIAPRSGHGQIANVLNHCYDLQAKNSVSDYSSAATDLLTLVKKRSLVILLTNLRDESHEEILQSYLLLRKKHLVLVADIQENDVHEEIKIQNNDDALNYLAQESYLRNRKTMHQKLINQGVWLIDCTAQQLPSEVVNTYNIIKKSGYL